MSTSYMHGYEYDIAKRGGGWDIQCGRICICGMTKKSADAIKRKMISQGYEKSEIEITKND